MRGRTLKLKPVATKLNLGETAFARVRYSNEALRRLSLAIRNGTLGTLDRFGVMRDAVVFAKSGHMKTDEVLALSENFEKEKNYIVLAEIAGFYLSLKNLLSGKPEAPAFARFAAAYFGKVLKRIGFSPKKGEPSDMSLLRGTLLYTAGTFGDHAAVRFARNSFKRPSAIHPDLRGAVYRIIAEKGTTKEYGVLLALYHKVTLEEEKDRLLRALMSTPRAGELKRMLVFAFSEKARGQDTLKAVSFAFANPYGRAIAWNYLKKEWPKIMKRFGGGHLFSRFIAPASMCTSEREAADIERFFKEHQSDGIERSISQAVEQIRSHAAWYRRDGKAVKRWLKEVA
jgi:aminopeptidase 2